jgi:hypothetical protein
MVIKTESTLEAPAALVGKYGICKKVGVINNLIIVIQVYQLP